MKFKSFLLFVITILLTSCQKEQQSEILPYINLTVEGKAIKMDSVIAVYDDSAGVMSLIGAKYSGVELSNLIAIGFKFSTGVQAPKTYDASKIPIEMMAIYRDSSGIYSTAKLDSLNNPDTPIGLGILNLTSHNLQLHTIAGNFDLRPKIINPQTWEPGTKTIQINGSFQSFYVFLARGGTPPVPMKIAPKITIH
ncbi:hypothetical protein JGI1_01302 [Candidatus Thermokryptus mobilis]|uniref:Uncharacterized protein n=1 Tax=Candidatus Thermokryptus mobilis TaxID=1643428 RepID=A0A0S4N3S6_9BACT|nr:hypothetical protein [Candidatus Thermokryptus mobilis]CUU05680.1 hypothetical protein JGI1_01302 [Candidatus Thermokryptus mobilis]